MIAEARRRAVAEGLGDRCRFEAQDLSRLDAGAKFDLVIGVTVLQHILDPAALAEAVSRMTDHLAPGGRMGAARSCPGLVTRSTAIPASSVRGCGANTSSSSGSAGCAWRQSREWGSFTVQIFTVAAPQTPAATGSRSRRPLQRVWSRCRSTRCSGGMQFIGPGMRCSCLSRESDQGQRHA